MSLFLGHSKNKYGIEEPLLKHLTKVSELSEKFASQWGNGIEGYVTGIAHDLGKYSVRFQNVLKGIEFNIDHATPGALAVLKLYQKEALAAGIAIEGHHEGLLSGVVNEIPRINLKSGISKSGKKYSVDNIDEIMNLFKIEGGTAPVKINSDYINLYRNNEFSAAMFYVRMLFSALVDADFLSTEAHFARTGDEYLYRSGGEKINGEIILDKLFRYVERIRVESRADYQVKKMRDDLFSCCLNAGEREQGIYTLTAPTGTGKTLAMLAFAARHVKEHKLDRIIFILPYLNIIEQTAKEYETILSGITDMPYVLQDHSLAESPESDFSRLLAENWDAPVIVTTTVRFFEGLFANRSTACRRLHNLANSIILFDEAQTMPRNLALPTLATLSYLSSRYNTTVVFSTATQPAFDFVSEKVSKYAKCGWNSKEIVSKGLELFTKAKRVEVQWPQDIHSTIAWDELCEAMLKEKQVCTIVNLKKHAKSIFDILYNYDKENTFHISTNMCPLHRLTVLEEVKTRIFDRRVCHLVSTQCIEAGVNIDFPVLYRAMAPFEAIIQAAGRCNRNGRLEYGKFIVFIPELENEFYPSNEYRNATNIVKRLLSEKGELDIYSKDTIKEYYRLFFEDTSVKNELQEALETLDFKNVARYYKWIDNKGVNILVPYKGNMELFNQLANEARNKGINSSWERRARSISVGAWVKKDSPLYSVLEPVFYSHSLSFKRREDSGWYILLDQDNSAYSEYTGLNIEAGSIETIV